MVLAKFDYCDNCKEAICCKDITLPIELTLGDIFRVAKSYNKSMSTIFAEFCSFSVTCLKSTDFFLPHISFGLPCKFLQNNRCEINSVKPTACMKFPAFSKLEKSKNNNGDSTYACVNEALTKEEEQYLTEIYRLAERELRITSVHLFGGGNPLLKMDDVPEKISGKNNKEAPKVLSSNLSKAEEIRALTSIWFYDLSDAMRKEELTYQFVKEDGSSEERKLNLWQHCVNQITSAEKNKGILDQLEFSSRKYFEIRKKFE